MEAINLRLEMAVKKAIASHGGTVTSIELKRELKALKMFSENEILLTLLRMTRDGKISRRNITVSLEGGTIVAYEYSID